MCHHPAQANWRPTAALELKVEESEVEGGIVRDERRILDELEQLLDLLREKRLVRQENVGESVHHFRFERHVPFGVEICVEMTTRLDAMDDLDAADLDHAVAAARVQASSFRIEDDLTHE